MFTAKVFFNKLVKKYKECDFAFIPVIKLYDREKEYFNVFLPLAKTVIVIYYPIINPADYIWYSPDKSGEKERCNIDDRANEICEFIKGYLLINSINTKIVPYPETSGLQFRYAALASGYGELGKNAFYLHPIYGSKVHLRILASELESKMLCSIKVKTKSVCLSCGECINNCPADAYKNGFDGLKCRKFRMKRGEYEPFGERRILRYCRRCVYSCNAGLTGKNI